MSPHFGRGMNTDYFCRAGRTKKAHNRDGMRQAILTLLTLAGLTALGYAVDFFTSAAPLVAVLSK